MTPTFYVKILSYYQKGDVYKKNRPKNIYFWTNGTQFCTIKFFWVVPRNFFKISYLAPFWKFLSEFWRVISNYTYQQVINSNMGRVRKSMVSWYPGYQPIPNLAANFWLAHQLRVNSQQPAGPWSS